MTTFQTLLYEAEKMTKDLAGIFNWGLFSEVVAVSFVSEKFNYYFSLPEFVPGDIIDWESTHFNFPENEGEAEAILCFQSHAVISFFHCHG